MASHFMLKLVALTLAVDFSYGRSLLRKSGTLRASTILSDPLKDQSLAPSSEFVIDRNTQIGLGNAFDNPIKNAAYLNDFVSVSKYEAREAADAPLNPKETAARYAFSGLKQPKKLSMDGDRLSSVNSLSNIDTRVDTESWKEANENIDSPENIETPPTFHAAPDDPNFGSLDKPMAPSASKGFPSAPPGGGSKRNAGSGNAGSGVITPGGLPGNYGSQPSSPGGGFGAVQGGSGDACSSPTPGFLPGRGSPALFRQLEDHEGNIPRVYKDSRGYPTFGIGHLITSNDEEYGKPVGTPVSPERVQAVFRYDAMKHINEAKHLYPNFDALPEEVQLIVTDMAFNMGAAGGGGLAAFKNMKRAVLAKQYGKAADEMTSSRWCGQVGRRCTNLVGRMRALGNC